MFHHRCLATTALAALAVSAVMPPAASAHTDSLGFVISDGSTEDLFNVSVYYGSWHGEGAPGPEGSLDLFLNNSLVDTEAFVIVPNFHGTDPYGYGYYFVPNGTVPDGLVAGTNYFFPNITTAEQGDLTGDPSGHAIYAFQYVTFVDLAAGNYTFAYAPGPLSATWTPAEIAINNGSFAITDDGDLGGVGGTKTNIVAVNTVAEVNNGDVNPVFEGGTIHADADSTVTPDLSVRVEGGTFDVDAAVTLTATGDITDDAGGGGNLHKTGDGTLILAGSNSYTGATSIDAGKLVADGGGAIGDASAVTVAAGATLELGAAETIGSLAGGGTVAGGAYTLTTGGNNDTTTFSGSIATGGLVKEGSGTLTLSGANTYAGDTLVSGGTLSLAGGAAIADSGAVIVASGATLDVQLSETIGSLAGDAGSFVTLNDNSLNTGDPGDSTEFAGTISGTGGLAKYGGGTMTLSGSNSYTGWTTVYEGAVVLANGAAIADTGAVWVNANAELELDASETIGSLAGAGTVQLGANTLTVGGDGTSTEFSGTIGSEAAIAFVGSWDLVNAPSWGDNPPVYSGVEAASLLFGGDPSDYQISTISADPSQINNRAFVDGWADEQYLIDPAAEDFSYDAGAPGYNDPTGVVGAAYSAYVRDHAIDYPAMTLVNYAFTVGGDAGGGLTKIGGGTLTLSGTNTYTGLTSVEGGTLSLKNGAAIADSGAVSLAAGATLDLQASETIGSLAGAAGSFVTLGDSTLTTGGNGDSTTFAGSISGTGGLVKDGTGTMTLSGANTYTGATLVNAATLSLTGGSAIADSGAVTIASGATLDVQASETIGTLSGAGDVTLANASTLTLSDAEGTLDGDVSGSGTFAVAGGTESFGGALSNSGGLDIGPAGHATILEAGSVTVTAGAAVFMNGATELTNQGSISGVTHGVSAAGTSAGIVNSGTIESSVDGGYGIYSSAAEATIENQAGGEITASYAGVYIAGGSATVTNDGTITALGTTLVPDIDLFGDGIQSRAAGTSVINNGTINGAGFGNAIVLYAGGSVTNSATGVLNSTDDPGAWGIAVQDGDATVVNEGEINAGSGIVVGHYLATGPFTQSAANSGTINAVDTGIWGFKAAISATNSGTITAENNAGVRLDLGGSLSNSGSITGGSTSLGYGVVIAGGEATITNELGGTIGGGAGGILVAGTGATVTNHGAISGPRGIGSLTGAAITLDNSGTIEASGYHALITHGEAHVTNQLGGTMSGAIFNAVYAGGAGSTVTNYGTMTGGNAAIYFDGARGTIDNSGLIRVVGTAEPSVTSAIYSSAAGTAITNSGTIDSTLVGGRGIFLQGGDGEIVNESGGTIAGNASGAAILLSGAGYTLSFEAGSTVAGLVDASSTTGTNLVTLAGALDGSYAGGSGVDDVTIASTYSLTGVLDGGAGASDVFALGGDTDGTFDSGLGINFEARAKRGVSTWTLTGIDASTAAWTIEDGVLAVSGGGAIHDAVAVEIEADGTLALLASEAIGQLSGAGAVTLDAYTLAVVGAGSTVFSGVVSGTGNLALGGGGTLTLSGANSYTGLTSVENGTLRLGASGVLADASTLSVLDAGAFDLQGYDETVALAHIEGTLGGSGTLTAAVYRLLGAQVDGNLGSGVLHNGGETSLLNGSAAAETVAISVGTLRLGAEERLADAAALTVYDGATFDLQSFDETVGTAYVAGTLAGTGTLTATAYALKGAQIDGNLGTGTIEVLAGTTLLNGTAAASTVLVSDGTLELGADERLVDTVLLGVDRHGTFELSGYDETVGGLVGSGNIALGEEGDTGTLTILAVEDSAFAGSITGTGDVVKAGEGEFALTGHSQFDGTMSVTSGLLTVNGSLLADVVVEGDGMLGGIGTIGQVTVEGYLAPGNSIGTITINGDLVFAPGSVYQVEVNPALQGDRTDVTGTITIAPDASVDVLAEDGDYDLASVYRILTADGGVSGEFGGIETNLAFLDPHLLYTANAVDLVLIRNDIDFADFAITPNQATAAGAVQELGYGNPLFNAVVQLSGTEARQAFTLLSGEAYASVLSGMIQSSRHVRDSMLATSEDGDGVELWGDLIGTWGRIKGRQGIARTETRDRYLIGGFDYRSHGLRIGVAGGLQRGDFDSKGIQSASDLDTSFVGASAALRRGAFGIEAGAAWAWHDVSTVRSIAFGDFADQARSEFSAETRQFFVEASADLLRGPVHVQPFGRFAWVKTEIDGFGETGGAAALTVSDGRQDVRLGTLGVRLSGGIDAWGGTVSPKAQLGWQHGWGDLDSSSEARFATGHGFQFQGARLAEDAADIELGIEWRDGAFGVGVSYTGFISEYWSEHGAALTVEFGF